MAYLQTTIIDKKLISLTNKEYQQTSTKDHRLGRKMNPKDQ